MDKKRYDELDQAGIVHSAIRMPSPLSSLLENLSFLPQPQTSLKVREDPPALAVFSSSFIIRCGRRRYEP